MKPLSGVRCHCSGPMPKLGPLQSARPRKENFLTFRTCCNEDTCYQRLVGWGGTIRTSALENQPAKTSVESSSWSFTGLFARSFTGPFDYSFTGVLGSVIHRALRAVFQSLPA